MVVTTAPSVFFLSRSDGQMVSPLEASLWIPCGDSFKKVYEEEWVQEAHASEYSGQESEYHWRDQSSWYWGTQDPAVEKILDRWHTTLAVRAKATAGRIWAPRHADSDCLPVPMDDGWCASRELPSVSPGLSSAPQSSWQPYPDTSAPKRKATEPPEDTPVVVESLDTPAPLTPCVHESTHPVQFGIMPKRLPLPHPDDEILSGYEEDLSSIQDGYTALGNGRSGNATWSVSQSILIPMTGGTVHLIQSIALTTTCPTVYLSRHASAF